MHHFGVLIPPTNTTAEDDFRRYLPPAIQAHVRRIPLLNSDFGVGPGPDEDEVDVQSRMLGLEGVEVIGLMQTTAGLDADDVSEIVIRRITDASGVPAVTASQAIGKAVRALGARRIALVAPSPVPVLEREKHHYEHRFGLDVVALESFAGADGPEAVHAAMAATDRPEIEVIIVRGGGAVPTMAFISEWESAFGKPVITPNQALIWAMLEVMNADERIPALGRLLADRPAFPAA